jgi:integrase/recombinase XerD
MLRIRFSKTPKTLPTVLTKEEVARLIQAIHNPKHRLMIKLIYSAGLRVNELVHLKPEHFDFTNNYGWVRQGKGNKDRMFIIAESLKQELTEYIATECQNPSCYLFKGNTGHITTATIRAIVKSAAKTAKIPKNIHPHTLRHSFATHIIENGESIASLQSLLGHSSAETTMMYVHLASPKMIHTRSPLDSFQEISTGV